MATIHYLKRSKTEAVVKCYTTNSGGGTINVALSSIASNGETFNANDAFVTIREIFWGSKKDKQIDVTRIVPSDPAGTHGHYFFINTGHYDFNGFVDDTYANSDIQITGDGAFHVILKLGKVKGYT